MKENMCKNTLQKFMISEVNFALSMWDVKAENKLITEILFNKKFYIRYLH